MAEQVRVRRPNVALRIPQVRFVAQEAEARAKSGIAQSLQRMSNYFLQQAEQKAQIEGAEYGAAQAPTEQQIQDAAQRGEELELPGDQTTVYGKAARKAALSIASDEVTALASKAHTNIAGVFDFLLENDNLPEAERQAYLDDMGVPDDSPQSFALAFQHAKTVWLVQCLGNLRCAKDIGMAGPKTGLDLFVVLFHIGIEICRPFAIGGNRHLGAEPA